MSHLGPIEAGERTPPSVIETQVCRSCGAALRRVIVDLGMSPLSNRYLTSAQLNQMERFYPLRVYICEECLLAQVEEFEHPDEIFNDYLYFSSFSDTSLDHARHYAEMVIPRFGIGPEHHVIELASNDGYLLQYFVARGVPVLGIEPARNIAAVATERGIPTLVEFFGESTARRLVSEGNGADLIVANNVVAHVPQLNDFVKGMKILLKPGGVITIECSHILRMIEGNQFDSIYHEHFCYFSCQSISRILNSHGLTVFDVDELPTHGGSLRFYVCHQEDTTRSIQTRVTDLIALERTEGMDRLETYSSFGENVRDAKRKLLSFLLSAQSERRSVVGYGAPAKGNTLLNYCGIRDDFIEYTVDRSPYKQGHFLPGTHIPIYDPSRIKETHPDYVLVLPWNLIDEISSQMSCIRGWGGRFVVAIPEVRVF